MLFFLCKGEPSFSRFGFEEEGSVLEFLFLFVFFGGKVFEKMIRWWISALQLAELFVSSMVHLLYGFYIFSTAVAGDLSQALNEWFIKPNANIEVKREDPSGTNVDALPPIVLVHGIFGFGKGVCLHIYVFSFFTFIDMGFRF